MKKILSMFAFVAAIVMGALTLASCGDDDDEPVVVKHTFTYAVKVGSKIPDTEDKPEFKEDGKFLVQKYMNKLAKFESTENEAVEKWNKIVEDLEPLALTDVNDLYNKFKDETVYLQIDINKDGLPWKTMKWTVLPFSVN